VVSRADLCTVMPGAATRRVYNDQHAWRCRANKQILLLTSVV
jgi:hypothetical protein